MSFNADLKWIYSILRRGLFQAEEEKNYRIIVSLNCT